ncbi:hypothetical protein BD289DRAFT_366445 [Coniella lustricola]|uniref:F-box domain-containing protein n=1 Tax=Coniella lustricola TaxID=2025994 RepID=A0A2T3AAZ1_9PEZI|nr:hypothetical protein BD289DRAFT_366445 [Coniella lustricola]
MALELLPCEIISIIAQDLQLEDIFNLSLCCRRLQYLTQDDRSCKALLESRAIAPAEVQDARSSGRWAYALRRLVRRRQAFRAAAPYTAAIVAVAESWLYVGGVLSYVLQRKLRIFDLHKAQPVETVIDVRLLMRAALAQPRGRNRYCLRLLHYADGFLTCLYTRAKPQSESRLVLIDVLNKRLATTSPPLDSINKIFVRNNQDFLYFGTHSEVGEDGFRRWVLMSYSIKANSWLDRRVHLVDLVGSDIGQCICFEIFDGYFYGLSNQNTFAVDEKDWTSYYHCFRFPLDNPTPETTQRSLKERMVRRQNFEGPIDDRWSFIRLVKNETTGRLQILESRKEWLDRKGSGQRNYYTTDVIWAQSGRIAKGGYASDSPGNTEAQSSTSNDNNSATVYPASTSNNSHSSSGDDSSSSRGTLGDPNFTLNQSRSTPSSPRGDAVCNPPEKVDCLLRDPYKTHTGDDASTGLMFTLSKCHIRSYYFESQAFVDLVDNPHPDDDSCRTRLQLRAGSRKLYPADQVHCESPTNADQLSHTARIKQLFQNNGENTINFWPPTPEEAEEVGATADSLDILGKIINPPSHSGNVKGVWDDRSFVFSAGSNADGMQAIVFIGFDPSINLPGLQRWGAKTGGEESWPPVEKTAADQVMTLEAPQNACDTTFSSIPQPVLDNACGEALSDDILCNEYGTAAEGEIWGASSDAGSPQIWSGYSSGDEEDVSSSYYFTEDLQPQASAAGEWCNDSSNYWACIEDAMYQQISVGFNGLPDFAAAKRSRLAVVAASAT